MNTHHTDRNRLGVVLLLAALVLLAWGRPFGTRAETSPISRAIEMQGWEMTIPGDWNYETGPFGPDEPFLLAWAESPREPDIFTRGDTSIVAGSQTDRYVVVVTSKQPPSIADFEVSLRNFSSCLSCAPVVEHRVETVDVHGRSGARADVVRSDGTRERVLVVTNACELLVTHVTVAPDADADMRATAEQMLKSIRLTSDGTFFGRCWF